MLINSPGLLPHLIRPDNGSLCIYELTASNLLADVVFYQKPSFIFYTPYYSFAAIPFPLNRDGR
jgi:hypothetical protein